MMCRLQSIWRKTLWFQATLLIASVQVSANEAGKCLQNELKKGLKARLATVIESKLTATVPWKFTPEQESRFQSIFLDPAIVDSEKPRKLFDALVEERLRSAPPLSRMFLRKVADDALKQRSVYSWTLGPLFRLIRGPHYNPLFNRTSMKLFGNDDIRDLIAAFHEIEHGYDRNTRPLNIGAELYLMFKESFMVLPTPITPAVIYQAESRAMGAQWELAQRLPKELREKLIESLREVLDPKKESFVSKLHLPFFSSKQSATRIALASLENAHLSREEFLKTIAPTQGYDGMSLLKEHYSVGLWKPYLLATSLMTTAWITWTSKPKERQEQLNDVNALDIRYLVKLYYYLFESDGREQTAKAYPEPQPIR